MSEGKKEILLGDCLELMKDIPNGSIDMIFCDLPYGMTACKWDTILPFDKLWEQYERIIKPNGAIVLTASQPFTSALVMSNPDWFRYSLVWDKMQGSNPFEATKRPLKSHEDILIFYKKQPNFNPQKTKALPKNMRDRVKNSFKGVEDGVYGKMKPFVSEKDENERYPLSVFYHSSQAEELHKDKRLHPTQKPIALCEYLIKTYTNEGDLILDNCAGSGTTGIACLNTKRQFILMEQDPNYFEKIKKRVGDFNKNFEQQTLFGNEM
jgi:site-specific DNA-methyltransferase (adenine-specific)